MICIAELRKFIVIWLSVIAFGSMFTGGVLTLLSRLAGTGERALGDINGDGVVNILDVRKCVLAWSEIIVEPLADVDGDGVVNILDVRKLMLIWSGVI